MTNVLLEDLFQFLVQKFSFNKFLKHNFF